MYQRILVPVDGSPTSNRGLAEAIALARLTKGHVRVIHGIDELSFALAMDAYAGIEGNWLETLRAEGAKVIDDACATAAAAGVQADSRLSDSFNGSIDELVLKEAAQWPADLIVLGTHGRRGVSRIVLGSTAERILRQSPVPVLLVRAAEIAVAQTAAPRTFKAQLPGAAVVME